jgi:hypothetical protein
LELGKSSNRVMTDILDTVQQQVGSIAVQQLTARLGVDPVMAQRAVDVAVPAIVSALAARARADGADVVHRESTSQASNPSSSSQVLGDQHADVAQRVSDATGVSREDAGAILGTVAPAVLRGIGEQVQQQGINPAQLADVLGKAVGGGR